jgi:hypothetical protein
MRFPSKVTPYKLSILVKFPIILNILEREDLSPEILFQKVKKDVSDIGEFVEILACLFALGKILLIDERSELHYVG